MYNFCLQNNKFGKDLLCEKFTICSFVDGVSHINILYLLSEENLDKILIVCLARD